eukprot:CAMPEP_0119394162 /NCGR_PEP_ID=MMETSP1334-20130426/128104_1 /TAXON_ID=127549 /ORGANISM="Calcidiscus leptoporus, Strain RCC1130" /LENGTH=135 /DNA_ID=CAMNT_0007417363 /DNA_START=114 /DNA_END=518 /DNA_ORIENTATION=-
MSEPHKLAACMPPADLGLCANVLISPEPRTREAILQAMMACCKPGATLLLLVPAMRSIVLTRSLHTRWVAERRRQKLKPSPLEMQEARNSAEEKRGIFSLDGVRTKHYTVSEMHDLIKRAGLELVEYKRVEYGWE